MRVSWLTFIYVCSLPPNDKFVAGIILDTSLICRKTLIQLFLCAGKKGWSLENFSNLLKGFVDRS